MGLEQNSCIHERKSIQKNNYDKRSGKEGIDKIFHNVLLVTKQKRVVGLTAKLA